MASFVGVATKRIHHDWPALYSAAHPYFTETSVHYRAAKEAVAKALGIGFRNNVIPKDIEIEHTAWGKPILHLFGPAALIAEQSGLYEWDVSLSHAGHFAVAIAVALRRGIIKDATEVDASIAAHIQPLEKSDLAMLQELLEQTETDGFMEGDYDER